MRGTAHGLGQEMTREGTTTTTHWHSLVPISKNRIRERRAGQGKSVSTAARKFRLEDGRVRTRSPGHSQEPEPSVKRG